MTKKLIALLLAAFMLTGMMAGCNRTEEVWFSYSDDAASGVADNNSNGDDASANDDGDNGDDTDATDSGDSKTTTKGRRTKTTTAKKTTQGTGKKTRNTKSEQDSLTFTPVADAGADYDVKGKVSIAVDTVRPADYEAMFDVMLKLYPNISFEFDYWAQSSYDDGREYLTTRMNTQTAANIMWDEAGEIPTYIMNGGWIKPITDYVAKDPEAKYIPANIKSDYTYYGELFAVPHSAVFETVGFNTKLMEELGIKESDMPGLEWTMDEYEALLDKGKAGWTASPAKCVAISTLYYNVDRVSFWNATANGGNYSTRGYNVKTGQYEVKYLKQAAIQFREWREINGIEGWYHRDTINKVFGGVSLYSDLWGAGRSLIEDTNTVYAEKWDEQYPDLEWKLWTAPNRDGKMGMHVDHCFITSTTPEADMDACFQVLRFMTYSSNGNLARLTMYEDSQKGKYNLSSHVYYPTTTSPTVINKFNKLSCTDEVDEYLVANIKNSARFDLFKFVPGLRDATNEWTRAIDDITDGLDPTGAGLDEPAIKVNAKLKEYQTEFKKAFDKYYG